MKTHAHRMLSVVAVIFLGTYALAPYSSAQQHAHNPKTSIALYERPYHFGFMLGFNRLNFQIGTKPNLQSEYGFEQIQAVADYGFQLGIVSNIRLSDHFDLRFIPTVLINGASFANGRYIEYLEPDGNEIHSVFEASYVEFPMHVKYNFPHMNYTRIYLTAGPKYTYVFNNANMVYIACPMLFSHHLTRHDWYLEAGGGFEYYFPYFKFAMEIKASLGMRNLLEAPGKVGAHYYNAIEHLRSRAILVSFYLF